MTLLPTTYCTQADMERRFSAAGVTAFADHDADGLEDDGVIDDCINQATDEINLYLRGKYAEAGLAGSTLVNRWAATLACYHLCECRGNPPPESLQRAFDWLMTPETGMLALIAACKINLPGVALNGDRRPTWSNLHVDRRWPHSKVRVTRSNSSDAPTALSQDGAEEIPIRDGF